MIVPVGFALGHLMLCPLFLSAKLSYQPLDPMNRVTTIDDQVGSSLHVYDWTDRFIIVFVAVVIFFQQITQTLAFRYEKVGRIAPMYYI